MKLGLLDGTRLELPGGPPPSVKSLVLGMSRQYRWAGQTSQDWTVGHHSLLAASLVDPAYRLDTLLHDVEEAILGDWPTPICQEMTLCGMPAEEFKGLVRMQCAQAFCPPKTLGLSPLHPAVVAADRRALEVEAALMCHPNMLGWIGSSGSLMPKETEAWRELVKMSPWTAAWRWAAEVWRAVEEMK